MIIEGAVQALEAERSAQREEGELAGRLFLAVAGSMLFCSATTAPELAASPLGTFFKTKDDSLARIKRSVH